MNTKLQNLQIQKELLENHLSFSSYHRGKVTRRNGAIHIESSHPAFQVVISENATNLTEMLENYNQVRLLPWSKMKAQELEAIGLKSSYTLAYMTLETGSISGRAMEDLEIQIVSDEKNMDIFTEIQTKGFLNEGESYEDWYTWLRKYNHANLRAANQLFYIGFIKGKPAGVTLLLITEKIAGIYAVATLPEYRKQGVSTAILKRATSDALAKRCGIIALQVLHNTYVETFYTKLGFRTSFISSVFSK